MTDTLPNPPAGSGPVRPSGSPQSPGSYEDFYEQDAARYNIWETPKRGSLYFKEVLRYERLLELVPREARRVLDLGCGDGFLSVMLAKRGHQVTALDLARGRLDKFADKAAALLITQVQASATETGLADASFDAVVSSEVLEHLAEPRAMLAEVVRLLAPGGTFVVCVPNDEQLRLVECPRCRERFNVDGHLHSFSAATLTSLLAEAGLVPQRTRTFRNKRTEKVRGGVIHIPYGAWIRGTDALFSRAWPRLDQYLAAVSIKPTA